MLETKHELARAEERHQQAVAKFNALRSRFTGSRPVIEKVPKVPKSVATVLPAMPPDMSPIRARDIYRGMKVSQSTGWNRLKAATDLGLVGAVPDRRGWYQLTELGRKILEETQ